MQTTGSVIVDYEDKMKKPKEESAAKCRKRKARCASLHLNNLWSLWYGVFAGVFQAYIAVKCIKRILGYSVLSWPEATPLPILEMNVSLGLTGASVLLLPFFMASAIFKIGNLANDGFKLGRQLSVCSRETRRNTNIGGDDEGGGSNCGLFRHGGPTAPFLHLVIGFCLLLPKLLMEARLIEAGLLPQETIWKTDLDFMVVHRDRLVVLSFMTASNSQNNVTFNAPQKLIADASPLASDQNFSSASTKAVGASSMLTHKVVKTLRKYLGHESHHNLHIDSEVGSSLSTEFTNFALALMVYSVRYPSLFWASNKCMGLIFSFQLLINGLQTLLSYAGMSVLYKVQIVGPWKALPLLKAQPKGFSPLGGLSPFLLNPQVTLALYILSVLLILASSLVLYLYGHTRFMTFLNQERERKVITLKETGHSKWSYFTHCAALCVLISVGLCTAPLLHDYTLVYRGSLDGAILACIIGSILHSFLWIVVWLFLTIKQSWIFKLRVTIGKATVRQARSVKLVTDVELLGHSSDDPSTQPLLVLGNGRTYTVSDVSPKKAIMGVIQKAQTSMKKCDDGDEEQIYWLRPVLASPQSSPDGSKQLCWKKKSSKQKVTFNENSSTSNYNRNSKCSGSRKRIPGMEVDDGDYATLRELPIAASASIDDNISEEGKLLACVRDEHVTYASTSQDLVPPVDYEDPSPLLTPEPLDKTENTHQTPISVIVHNQNQSPSTGLTPRCLRRADSGMPHERSDSISTQSSSSPPDPAGSNHSETSSGIHSNESSEQPQFTSPISTQPVVMTQQQQQTRRATSVADLQQPTREEVQWKSCSLQRNVLPPTSVSFNHFTTNPLYGLQVNGLESEGQNVILENPGENHVVIRRNKSVRPKTAADISQTPIIKEEPFGRATNMRMTSFTDDLKNIQQTSSATLPHYPTTQPVSVNNYPHCSTMPLPLHSSNIATPQLGTGNSCNVYPRQHTTIPTHHNGVRLFNGTQNPYIKRLQNGGPISNNVRYITSEPIYTGINRTTGELYHYNS